MDFKKDLIEDTNFEFDDEEKFRKYIQYQLLLKQGFKRYATELNDYYVNFVNEPGLTAAVDAQNKVIYINDQVKSDLVNAKPEDRAKLENTVSMLIRHELLHSMLRHSYRTFIFIANKLGLDPYNLTKEELDKVNAYKTKPSLLYRQYNAGRGVTLSNGAGDLDLSRNYLDRDIEITREFGGLLLEDRPDWINYSFEQLLAELEKNERALKLRLLPIVYGDLDAEGNFTVDHEEDAQFNTATEIHPDDVVDATLPTKAQLKEADRMAIPLITWMKDKITSTEAGLWLDGDIQARAVNELHNVVPVIKIDNLDLYKNIKWPENPASPVGFKCFGLPIILLSDHVHAIFANAIGKSQFNTLVAGQDNTHYEGSVVELFIDDWLKKAKRGTVR